VKRVILVNIIIISILLISLEIITRVFSMSGIMGMDSNLIENTNGINELKKNSKGKVFGKIVYTDSNGFRVPIENFEYSKDHSSIFIIGDSVAFGNGVDEKKTFIGSLRIKNKNINFLNSSVPGYQIFEHNKNVNKLNDFKKIKKIFYVFTLNDVFEINRTNNNNQKSSKTNSFFKRLKKTKFFQFINEYLRNKSYLYMYIKGIASDPSKRYFQYALNYYKNKNDFTDIEVYLSKLKNISLARNIDLKIIILPYEFQTRKDNCIKENLIPQQIIEEILISLEVQYKNYTDFFCGSINPKSLFYKFDPMHLSEKGHKLVFLKMLKEI
jgi:hypothetical protein